MFLKSILLACLVVLVACQPTENYCSGYTFDFYNGYGEPQSPYPEQKWDWSTSYFDNGSGDTFDSYFFLDLTIGNVTYYSSDYPYNPVDFTCDIGNVTTAGYASYTYNLTDSIQLFREFYAPRSTQWIRVVDSVRNFGAEQIVVAFNYSGEYGSDESTDFSMVDDYLWVSSDGGNGTGDPPFAVNAAGRGAQILPVRMPGMFGFGNDVTSWNYNDVTVPAGESRSIMLLLSQYGSLPAANAGALNIKTQPEEMYANFNVSFDTVVNWAMCNNPIEVMNPRATYCEVPTTVTFAALFDATITVNDSPVTLDNAKEFTATVVNGANTIGYKRMISACEAKTTTIDFKLPPANLALAVDTTGSLPSVTASGGYGTYTYSWMFTAGGDLSKVFGGKATVTATDKEGCTKSADVNVPQLQLTVAPSAPNGKTSSASTLVASIMCFITFVLML